MADKKTRQNHYVPQWYQRGFFQDSNKLEVLDLSPEKKVLNNGRTIRLNNRSKRPTSNCFVETDLYTTFFGSDINDEIERRFFGSIDDQGARAVKAFLGSDFGERHKRFSELFRFIDAQKVRTPKGLDWIAKHYPSLSQNQLMFEMQSITTMHCAIWMEGIREIVSAKGSSVKFLLSDNPVTIYNPAFPPTSKECVYPDDPSILLRGSQTIFPLDKNHCLILTNSEYAKKPSVRIAAVKRTNPKFFRQTLARTDALIESRCLSEEEVTRINLIIKARARRYLASGSKDCLYPEKSAGADWDKLSEVLLPPKDELYRFGGETFVGYKDGSTYYQDAFGRTGPSGDYLQKTQRHIGRNDLCGCGSGKKFKNCCLERSEEKRPSWKWMSIRERNLAFFNGILSILQLDQESSWEDVRRNLQDKHVKEIHELYAVLWPKDTDIFELLPKHDGKLRALYSGVIDPRILPQFVFSAIPLFDEILVQHPIIHPDSVKEKFSPSHVPQEYLLQTLKNLMLFFQLMPFIDSGSVNFVPDPCIFDQSLRWEMLGMADRRRGQSQPEEAERILFEELGADDLSRSISMSPDKVLEKLLLKQKMDATKDDIKEFIAHVRRRRDKDPLSLLNDGGDLTKGSQVITCAMAPNFEIAMYIAQATGSLLITDSLTRWSEFNRSKCDEPQAIPRAWVRLAELLDQSEFFSSGCVEDLEKLQSSNESRIFRRGFKQFWSAISQPSDSSTVDFDRDVDAVSSALKAMGSKMVQLGLPVSFRLKPLIPSQGLVHTNVQRLLLKSGLTQTLNCVPMALLFSFDHRPITVNGS
jgi:hypothetical protein